MELETANNRHQAEVFELKHQLSRFNSLVEKGNQALQQKAQVRSTVLKQNKQNSEYWRKIGIILFWKHWKFNEKMFLFAQDEKTLTTLMYEIQEIQEILNKQKTENNVRQKFHINKLNKYFENTRNTVF